ncbi:glycoside hydrolase family 13 protein [Clostridium sp. 19966]|uniref:glycoside hydrolase family 13 protein n=1 Tax=Clostridium sp. 19966 TaxID=2768166 RepID=UPI0028DE1FB0|nr:glycoside hydrolase family 13 protein [Clostridium sp. 19966]MDT8717082.1 glycoside hydrolase family 13 protein [Clostridium sp. 19966]
MNKYAIYHQLEAPYVYGIDEDTLVIRLRTAKGDLRRCRIYYKDRYDWEKPYDVKAMNIADTSDLFDYYEAKITIKEKRFRYIFELEDNLGDTLFLNERGLVKELAEPVEQNGFQFPYLNSADLYESPTWMKEGIVYQIMPDRFCNGDKSNDPKDVMPWGAEVTQKSMFGGDLQGIIDKLDYLKELGVNIIYLTPVFESSTNHKYNTKDYYAIDKTFGDVNKAKELVEKCHEKGMKILFDAVFNHSGDDFFAFEDVVQKGEKSKYKDWFFVESFPVDKKKVNYATFANDVVTMPKLNSANIEVKSYLLEVAKYWIKDVGIDGWRLDVCDEVDHVFWRDFRKAIKSVKSDAVAVGEIMHESLAWLKGDQLDSIMNYPVKNLCVDFFAKRIISLEEFDNGLAVNRNLYMDSINRSLFNLVGSHDTSRFLTEAGEQVERLKLAAAFQFTYIGVPYIYYGDEIGLTGGHDPQCRKCMIWEEDKQNRELLEFFKKLTAIRKEEKTLTYGDFKTLFSENQVYSYLRSFNGEEIIVVLNNSDENKIVQIDRLSGIYLELMKNKEENIDKQVLLLPNEVKIFKNIR